MRIKKMGYQLGESVKMKNPKPHKIPQKNSQEEKMSNKVPTKA